MSEDRCPGCEALMTELDCADCLAVERHAASLLATQRENYKRKTHCSHGHELTPENTRIDVRGGRPGGYQVCRTCHKRRCASVRARRKAAREAS